MSNLFLTFSVLTRASLKWCFNHPLKSCISHTLKWLNCTVALNVWKFMYTKENLPIDVLFSTRHPHTSIYIPHVFLRGRIILYILKEHPYAKTIFLLYGIHYWNLICVHTRKLHHELHYFVRRLKIRQLTCS